MAAAARFLAQQMELMEKQFLAIFMDAANKMANLMECKLFVILESAGGGRKIAGDREMKLAFRTGQLLPQKDDMELEEDGASEEPSSSTSFSNVKIDCIRKRKLNLQQENDGDLSFKNRRLSKNFDFVHCDNKKSIPDLNIKQEDGEAMMTLETVGSDYDGDLGLNCDSDFNYSLSAITDNRIANEQKEIQTRALEFDPNLCQAVPIQGEREKSDSFKKEDSLNPKYKTCRLCNNGRLFTRKAFTKHYTSKHTEKYKCTQPGCGKCFSTPSNLGRHCEETHAT